MTICLSKKQLQIENLGFVKTCNEYVLQFELSWLGEVCGPLLNHPVLHASLHHDFLHENSSLPAFLINDMIHF